MICDSDWRTQSAQVSGWLGDTLIEIELSVDLEHQWWLNRIEQPDVAGCLDLDLNFSPSTNLIPIRRLNLPFGHSAAVKAAWLRFPGFELEPLNQVYRRLDENTYRYESGGGRFVADLKVDKTGYVTDYPGIWQAEASI